MSRITTETPQTAAGGALPELVDIATITRLVVRINPRTLRRWIDAGTFPPADVEMSTKLIYWRRSTIEAWLDGLSNKEQPRMRLATE